MMARISSMFKDAAVLTAAIVILCALLVCKLYFG